MTLWCWWLRCCRRLGSLCQSHTQRQILQWPMYMKVNPTAKHRFWAHCMPLDVLGLGYTWIHPKLTETFLYGVCKIHFWFLSQCLYCIYLGLLLMASKMPFFLASLFIYGPKCKAWNQCSSDKGPKPYEDNNYFFQTFLPPRKTTT